MKLHLDNETFEELIQVTSMHFGIPELAVRKDYFITIILKRLSNSDYKNNVVFKGGTSLSKCYPGSIERFSEDIDLTYIPYEAESNKQIDKTLKKIESMLTCETKWEKINEERSRRNKSARVYFEKDLYSGTPIKLEIGSSVRSEPYVLRKMTSLIGEYLYSKSMEDVAREYSLESFHLNVLDITRTFIDKVMAVKRHAITGTLSQKARHLYDIVKLYNMSDIQALLKDEETLKSIVRLTKETDKQYLEKRPLPKSYNPLEPYQFPSWEHHLDKAVKNNYEALHQSLLYTNKKQDFKEIVNVLQAINECLLKIDE